MGSKAIGPSDRWTPACRVLLFSLSLSATLLTGQANAGSEAGQKWRAYIDLEGSLGTERNIGRASIFFPMWQRSDSLFFGDVRLVTDDSSAIEGNLGVAYRHLFSGQSATRNAGIWGVYGYFDHRRSANDFNYRQLTFGSEWLARNWEVRGNLYRPEDAENIISAAAISGIGLNGTTVVARNGFTGTFEKALPGFDVEGGYRFGINERQEIWLRGGYFRFDDNKVPAVSGPRLRLEYRIHDPFQWQGAELSFGAEAQEDEVRGSQGFATVWLRIPLGKSKRPLSFGGMDRRMVQPIQRDVDIVTTVQASPAEDITETPLNDPASGEVLNVYFVAENGGGDCTQADPCAVTAAQADAHFGAGDVIVPLSEAGVIDADVSLSNPRQQVVGGGDRGSAVLQLSSGDVLAVTELGSRPTLGGTLILSEDSFIAGFDIEHMNAAPAITASDIANASVSDVNIRSSGGAGLRLSGISGRFRYSDGNISGVSSAAVEIASGDAVITLDNTTINDTGSGRSVDIQGTSGGSVSFDADSAITNINGTGIFLDSISGDVTFNGPVSITAATADAVTATNLGVASVAFTNGLNVTTAAGRGLVGSGGTLNVNTGSIDATGGEAVDIDGSTVGMSFTSLASTNSTDSGVDLNNVSGSINVSGATTVTNATNAGVDITGGSGSKTFDAVTINRQGAGINIDGGGNTLQFGQTTITNPGNVAFSAISVANTTGGSITFNNATHNIDQGSGAADAIALADNAASFSLDGGSVTTAVGGVHAALRISGAQAGVSFGATGGTAISQTGAGRLLSIEGVSGGNNILFSTNGSMSATASGNAGILIDTSDANITIANATLSNSLQDAVTINGGSGQMNLSNVDIANAGANGVTVTNLTGTLQFQNGGSVSNVAGDGIHVDGGGAATVVQVLGTPATNDFTSIAGDAVSVANTAAMVIISDVQGTGVTGDMVRTNNTGDVTITNGLTLSQVAAGRFINQTGTSASTTPPCPTW